MSLSFIASLGLAVVIYKNDDQQDLIIAMVLSIYILVSLYSVIFSWRRLKRPGMST